MAKITELDATELAIDLNQTLMRLIEATEQELSLLKDLAWMARQLAAYLSLDKDVD